MALKLRVSKKSAFLRFVRSRWGRAILISTLFIGVTGASVFTYYYLQYAALIEDKLEEGPFADMSVLYAAPRPVFAGETIEPGEIAALLRRAGYSEDSNRSRVGWFRLRPDGIEINPGPDAYEQGGAVLKFIGNRIDEIISLHDHSERTQFMLEPEPLSNLFDKTRQKRRVVRFDDIPQVMVDAVLSAEDKHFFQHAGFDPIGIMRAVYRDVFEQKMEGASTITQQLARTLWLGTERGWRRKIPEMLITLHLEQKLTKKQIFEYYANSIDVGHQGSFWIRGFAQGAQAYLGKDLRQVTLPEAALLAGLPKGPSLYDPFRSPDRAVARRNQVLKLMLDNEVIDEEQYEEALKTPLKVTREALESSDAPYFVDLVNDALRNRFQNVNFESNAYRVYTTLDLQLQRDAVAAVGLGMPNVDEQWKRRNKNYGTPEFPAAQVALVAINAETGELLAEVGGRSYGSSQLNRAVAKRQPGSSFKPIVYAAGMNSVLDPTSGAYLTPASTVLDEPTTFWFDEKPYEPKNHGDHYDYKPITMREALAKSKNIPAVKVAELVGYGKVAEIARAVGLNVSIQATPSIALGAYEVTPLEIAGAYTVFANMGERIDTSFIKRITERSATERSGERVYESRIEKIPALDPRVAYLVQNMMEEVLRSGTGAGVRGRGFLLPAAGKTGTSRDGWFVGFTSKIITAVWVGFDDNRDFRLEGAQSALPIWAEFMKRAHEHQQYKNVRRFEAPDGIITMEIDADTGQIAAPGSCTNIRTEVFIAGTQPVEMCSLHSRGGTIVSGWSIEAPSEVSEVRDPLPSLPAPRARPQTTERSIPVKPAPQAQASKQGENGKGRSFLDRIKSIFK